MSKSNQIASALPAAWSIPICGVALVAEAQEAGDVFRDCEVCPDMVVVPAGSFMMGSLDSETAVHGDEKPQHRVTIGYTFAVGVYEVMFDEWHACVRRGGCDEYEPGGEGSDSGRLPMVGVSWEDAWRYADWLTMHTGEQYRLLSEAEWEYAARAGTVSPYPVPGTLGRYGAPRTLCEHAHLGEATARYAGCPDPLNRPAGNHPAVAGSYRPNGFGLYDMAGNVWEWVDDCYYDSYLGAPTDGGARDGRASDVAGCIFRVLRGSSWHNFPVSFRSAARFRRWAADRFDDTGFRVARTVCLPGPCGQSP